MQGFRIFLLSRLEVQGEPLIDPRKRLEFRDWCVRENWGATFVVPFLEHYSWTGSFEKAWDAMVKEHGGLNSSVAGLIIETAVEFLRPELSEKLRLWWNRDVMEIPEAEMPDGVGQGR